MRYDLRVFKSSFVVVDQLREAAARQRRHGEDLLHGGLERQERNHLTSRQGEWNFSWIEIAVESRAGIPRRRIGPGRPAGRWVRGELERSLSRPGLRPAKMGRVTHDRPELPSAAQVFLYLAYRTTMNYQGSLTGCL